jgi:hypothetical protein
MNAFSAGRVPSLERAPVALDDAVLRVLSGTQQRMEGQSQADLQRWGKVVKANGIRAE